MLLSIRHTQTPQGSRTQFSERSGFLCSCVRSFVCVSGVAIQPTEGDPLLADLKTDSPVRCWNLAEFDSPFFCFEVLVREGGRGSVHLCRRSLAESFWLRLRSRGFSRISLSCSMLYGHELGMVANWVCFEVVFLLVFLQYKTKASLEGRRTK